MDSPNLAPGWRKRLTRWGLALSAMALAGCAPITSRTDANASDKRYMLGADYFNKGLLAPAMGELTKAIEIDPRNADAHNLLGLVYLRKAADSEEETIRAQCLRGEDLQLAQRDTDDNFNHADHEFKLAIGLKADFSEALNNAAVVAIHFGHFDDAIAFEDRAVANIIYREPFAAEGNLGWAYLQKHDLAHAAKALRQALFDQPQFCVGRYRLAKVYYEQKELDRAAEEIEKVVTDKACPIQEAFLLGGLIAVHRQDRRRAEELFSRCIALAPRSCLARECTVTQ